MTDLVCLPAIDIRDGKCVRLIQGDFAQETVYGDPLEQAMRYVEAGASWIHIVDLDAARSGEAVNRDLVAAIIKKSGVNIEIGGGIRNADIARFYLDAGARRVIVGTAGVESPELLASLVDAFPGHVGLGLDHRVISSNGTNRREVAVRGWESSSGRSLEDVVASVEDLGLDAVIVTDISRDGMLTGPDVEGYLGLLAQSALPIIASGGIKEASDLAVLAGLEVNGRVLNGVVVGKALLSGAMTVREGLAACVR